MDKPTRTVVTAHCKGVNKFLVSNLSQNLKIRRSQKVGVFLNSKNDQKYCGKHATKKTVT